LRQKLLPAGLVISLLVIILAASVFISIFWGRTIQPGQILGFAASRLGLPEGFLGLIEPPDYIKDTLDLALPRILLAVVVGAGLAWSGAILQALFCNPLADPYFLGVSAGASFGTTLVLVLAGNAAVTLPWLGAGLAPPAAFFFALAAVLTVYFIARQRGKLPLAHLILAGIAVSSVLTALVSGLMLIASQGMDHIILATMGSFARATWEKLAVALPLTLVTMTISYFLARDLNLILFGEETAFGLGVNVERRKLTLLILATLLGAAAVAVSGIIWFAGLIVPHLMRLLIGPDNRRLLPASGLAGSILLVIADSFSRTLSPVGEIPIGILTALCGAPFFMYLIMRSKKSNTGGV
jgi:iron complex transport system permease protein